MQEVTDRSALPYSAVCYITVTFPDGLSVRGSGVIVGPNDVLTAMHVLYYEEHGGWAVNVSVSPGADTLPSVTPFGVFSNVGRLEAPGANWDQNGDGLLTDAESQHDMALIGFTSRIGDITGWLPVARLAGDFAGKVVGYPAHPPSGVGIGMMSEDVLALDSDSFGVYDIESALGSGASGGPLLYSNSGQTVVAGVLSSGTLNGSRSTYAAFDGAGTWEWLSQAIAGNDALLSPLQRTGWVGTASGDVITGNALDNAMWAGAGNDVVDGGSGIDTAFFSGTRSQYGVSTSGTTLQVFDTVLNRDGSDVLTQVERLAFDDVDLALDLSGHAGLVARFLGVVFGPDAVHDATYAGVGLWHLDHGMSAQQLMALALQVRLGAGASDAAVVQLLYANVVGAAATPEESAVYEGLLASGQETQASLGLFAAETALIAVRIDMTGLAASGLAYEPLAG